GGRSSRARRVRRRAGAGEDRTRNGPGTYPASVAHGARSTARRGERVVDGVLRLVDDRSHHVIVPAVRVVVRDDHRRVVPEGGALEVVDGGDDEFLLVERIGVTGMAVLVCRGLEE